MKYFLWLLRIVVGLLFIFSGLVKANDPLGLSYKMDEFFEAWNMAALVKYSLGLSIIMIAFEILAGVAVLLGYAYRLFSFLLLLLIIFFTFLTGYVLYSGKIRECGCFGDCIKISNNQTFAKDVALLVMAVILFAYRGRIKPVFPKYPSVALLILTVFFAFGIQLWVLEHLPFYDCLAYKVGNNIPQKMLPPPNCVNDSFNIVFIYKKGDVTKDIPADSIKYIDSTWVYVDRKDKLIRKGNCEAEAKDFKVTDYTGSDHTQELLATPGYTLVWVIKDPSTARTDNIDRLHHLFDESLKLNIPFYALSSMDSATTFAFQKKWHLEGLPFMEFDGTASKTVMRSNPGLMALEQGTVRNKWSFRDYPKDMSLQNGKLNFK